MMNVSFLSVLMLCFAGGLAQTTNPDWADEKRFGPFQDAWASLDQDESGVYYLVRTTYPDDEGSWGKNFECVAVTETKKEQEKKTVTSRFVFKNDSSAGSQDIFEVEEKVQAVSKYGYTQPNAIKYLVGGKGKDFTDPLVFSDAHHCDLFHVPYVNGEMGGYELWVNADDVEAIPSYCLFMFNFFSRKHSDVYVKYEKTKCQDVTEKIKN
uniref:Lipocalin/cytosolic fatty-acid binding domain-containing protein n=1 Tax=Amblyomma maculatum TaxID=34609 RepID=G3MRB3_AMBMU